MVNDFARRQIRAATTSALRRAGATGVVPTPLHAVSRAIGIAETIDIGDLPQDLVARRPNALKRVLGAVLFRPRVIVVDRSQGSARGRFIEAHEISHKLLPTHEAIIRLDDEGRLFGDSKKLIEQEAEIGAAELLFQGDLFVTRALELPVSIAAPIALAPGFGSSMTAAVRHYPDYHPDPVAVLLAGRYARSSGRVPVWSGHESPSFFRRFGRAVDCFPDGLPAREGDEHPIATIVRQALEHGDIASTEIRLLDLRGEGRGFVAEAFFNQRLLMVMLTESGVAHRLSRRLDVRIV